MNKLNILLAIAFMVMASCIGCLIFGITILHRMSKTEELPGYSTPIGWHRVPGTMKIVDLKNDTLSIIHTVRHSYSYGIE